MKKQGSFYLKLISITLAVFMVVYIVSSMLIEDGIAHTLETVLYCEVGDGETVSGQIPAPGTQILSGSEVILYCGEEVPRRMVCVPDFVGLNRQQASDTAGQLGLYLQTKGNTGLERTVTVTAQSLEKDTLVPMGTIITLEFTDTQVRD